MGALAGVAALIALAAPSAQAAMPFTWVGEVFLGGADGQLHHQQRLAVEHSTGNVLRTDVVADQIVVHSPTATGLDVLTSFGSGELSDPYGVAIDQANGDVYVSDAGNNRIVRYTSDGQPVPAYTLDAAYSGPTSADVGSFRAPLAVDPTNRDLLVADPGNDVVHRYDSTGLLLGSFDGTGSPGTFTGLQDLAVDSTGDVVVVDSDGGDPADGAASRVERFDAAGAWEATIGPVAGAANVAVRPFDGDIVVSGNQDAVNRDQTPTVFVFDADGSAEMTFGTSVPQFSTISGVSVDGGPDGRLYVATDTSRGLYPGGYGGVSVQVFDAPVIPGPPTIDNPAPSVTNLTPWQATLTARLLPGNAETTYRFEYGTTTAYGSETEPGSASGSDPVRLSAHVADLQPSTTYHFRVVADNGIGGPVHGEDQTFTTPDRPAQPTVGQPTDVGTTTANLHGSVLTHGHGGTVRFTVIEIDGRFEWTSPARALAASSAQQELGATLGGLSPGTTYAVKIHGETSGGAFSTGWRQFTTTKPPAPGFDNPVPPVVPAASDVCPDPKLSPRDGCEPRLAAPRTNGLRATLVKGRTLRIAVPGAGTIRVAGSGVRGVVRRPAGRRTVTIRLALTKAGRRALAKSKSGRLRRKVTIAYRPTDGSPRSVTRTLTFVR